MPKAGRFAFMSDQDWDTLEASHKKLIDEIKKQRLKPDPKKAARWMQLQCQQHINQNHDRS